MTRPLSERFRSLFSSGVARGASTGSTLAPAPPPLAKRLNRNALTVAGVIMGMTVIACLVVLRGEPQTARRSSTDPTLAESSSPTFLDRPAHGQTGMRSDSSGVASAIAPPTGVARASMPTAAGESQDLAGTTIPMPRPSLSSANPPTDASLPPSLRSGGNAPREQAFYAALRKSAVGGDIAAPASNNDASSAPPASASLAGEEAHLVAYGDSVMRGTTQAAPTQYPTNAAAPLSNSRHSFMQQAGDLGGRSVAARLEPAASPYVLRAGTVIPAILLTAIASDLPGDCTGQVSRDIYDSQSQRTLLIPKGSKLMCRYDDQVVAGQGRLLVAWTRLMLPDGRSMTLPGLALKDAEGQTGAKGDVDSHTRRVFGRALLLSAIGAGAQLSQPRQASVLAAPTTGQIMAGAVGQEMSNVALEVLRRGMDQPPTITVPQGQTFTVFLNGDLVFDGPYTPTP